MARIYKPPRKPRPQSFNAARRHELVYNDPRWRPIREAVMVRDQGLCQRCLADGRLTPATQVHHRISPFQRGLSPADFDRYAWSLDNLEALCRDCHMAIHAEEGQCKTLKDNQLNKIKTKGEGVSKN